MLRTLHGYLTRDLLRVTLMALVPLTLLLTVLAIIEPMRKKGLATAQVLALFGYLMPGVLSLTLPLAVWFAVAIVYGRFAQNRELTACRASGVSTVTTLIPAVLMGLMATGITLLLGNFVTPEMAKRGERAIVANLGQIAYHMIQKESHVKFGEKYMVHATYVDKDNDLLYGVVAGEFEFKEDPETHATMPVMQAVVAQAARLGTHHDPNTDKYYASVVLQDPVGPISNHIGAQMEGRQIPLSNIEIPQFSQDKPNFHSWEKLLRVYRDPTLYGEIRDGMNTIWRKIRHNRILRDMARALAEGKAYDGFVKDGRTFSIRAANVSVTRNEARLAAGRRNDGTYLPVTVRILGAKDDSEITAESGKVTIGKSQITNRSYVTIRLSDNVQVFTGSPTHRQVLRKPSWQVGQIPLPVDAKMSDTDDPQEHEALISSIFHAPEDYTNDPGILQDIQTVQAECPKIRGKILAVMHLRIALGLSCVLIIAFAGVMGLLGGQILLSVVYALPATAVWFLLLTGSKMISNPKSDSLVGVVVVWGSLVGLLLVDVALFYRMDRR